MANNELLDAALGYATRSWAVIPLHTPTEDGCSCRKPTCPSVGKHPRTAHGLKDATTDPEQIEKWWAMWPEANVGIATGSEAGIIVLDVDGNDGRESIQGKSMPPTPTARTGKGTHWLFEHPGGAVRNFARRLPGLDLRADGGYIVAHPSLHANGKRYEWVIPPEEIEPAECPEWLIELLPSPSAESASVSEVVDGRIPPGARNSTLASLAGTMRRRGMTQPEILAALRVVNADRCTPALDAGEVTKVARSIASYKPDDVPFSLNGRVSGHCTMDKLREFFGDVEWAWERWIPDGHVTLIAGQTGVGKSWLMARLIASLTGNMAWPDDVPSPTSGRVLLVETESFRGPYAQRLQLLGVPDDAVLTPGDDPTYIPDIQGDEQLILYEAQAEQCTAIVVDSLSGGHGLDENSTEMKRILKTLAHWAATFSIPVVAVHHTRKRMAFEAQQVTLDRIRGSSAITQFCRSVVGLWQPDEGPGKPVRIDVIKANLCKPPEPLGFSVSDDGISFGDAPEPAKDVSAVDRAIEFLRVELRREPRVYTDLLEKAEPQGISKNSLYRARAALGIVTIDGQWSLPYELE